MKKLLLAVVVASVASVASAAIEGSSHDMNTVTFGSAGGGSACAYCHMPHGGAVVAGAPLWARNTNILADTAYTYYSSVFGGQPPPSAFGGPTKLCLSCHDGSQSVARVLRNGGGNLDLNGGAQVPIPVGHATYLGTDLSNDHPVSVTYNSANPTAGLAATPPSAFPLFTNNTIECSSCHEAHAARGQADAYPTRQFMVAYSGDFCVACHSLK